MKRILAVLTAVFAFTFLSVAQTGGASGSSGDQTGTEHAAHKKGAGKSTTLTGCLSGPNSEGVYELKRGSHTVEVGGLDDLSKHVGHEVRLHGSWAKSTEIGEKEQTGEHKDAAEDKAKGMSEEKGEHHFKVTSIDHISDTCKGGAAAGGHHKKGASSEASQPSTPPKL
jgi:hypothetical protein